MPYTPNTPNANDRINDTQPLILDNFQTISTVFQVNHVDFNTAGDAGKHAVVKFVSQGTFGVNDPAAFGATEVGLYNLQYNGVPELFVRKANAVPGPTTSFPITASSFRPAPDPQRGWTFLPSGLVMKFGFIATAGNNAAVALNGLGPNFTKTPFVQVTVQSAVPGAIVSFWGNVPGSFNIISTVAVTQTHWVAIGAIN